MKKHCSFWLGGLHLCGVRLCLHLWIGKLKPRPSLMSKVKHNPKSPISKVKHNLKSPILGPLGSLIEEKWICPCSLQEGWMTWPLKVPSSLDYYMILWLILWLSMSGVICIWLVCRNASKDCTLKFWGTQVCLCMSTFRTCNLTREGKQGNADMERLSGLSEVTFYILG